MKLSKAKITGFFSLPSRSLAEHNITAYNNAMRDLPAGAGTCAHCGTGIIHHVVVVDESGETKFIGTTCAEKVGLDKQQIRYRLTDDQVATKKADCIKREKAQKAKEENEAARHKSFHVQLHKNDSNITSKMVSVIGAASLKFTAETAWYGAAEIAQCLLNGDLNCGGYRMNSISMYRLADGHGKMSGRRNSKAYKAAYESVIEAFSDEVIEYLESTPAQLGWTAREFNQ